MFANWVCVQVNLCSQNTQPWPMLKRIYIILVEMGQSVSSNDSSTCKTQKHFESSQNQMKSDKIIPKSGKKKTYQNLKKKQLYRITQHHPKIKCYTHLHSAEVAGLAQVLSRIFARFVQQNLTMPKYFVGVLESPSRAAGAAAV